MFGFCVKILWAVQGILGLFEPLIQRTGCVGMGSDGGAGGIHLASFRVGEGMTCLIEKTTGCLLWGATGGFLKSLVNFIEISGLSCYDIVVNL